MAGWFDTETWPGVVVKAAFSPVEETFILDVSQLGVDALGGQTLVDISGDVRRVSWRRGRDSDIDTAAPGTCAIVLNNNSGDYDPLNLSGPYVDAGASLITLGTQVIVQAEKPSGLFWDLFTGEIADVAIDAGLDPTVTLTIADGLEKLGRVQLPVEPVEFAGDTTGERIGNLADRASWPATARAIDAGQVTLDGTTLGGNVLDLMHAVEQSEWGLLFVDERGYLVFYERHRATNASRSVTVQAELTDTSAAGELGMLELELALSRERVFNDVHITRQPRAEDPDEEPVEQVAQDATSIAAYGTLSFPGQAGQLLKADTEALGLAEGLVTLYKDPQVRIREVQINALWTSPAGSDLWPTLLGLKLLDRISVTRSYGAAPHTISSELLVQAISVEISSDPPGWEIRLATSEPPPAVDYLVLDSGQLGVDALGW